MKASILGRVRNTHLPRSKPLLPLFEAIVNALDAINEAGKGTDHSITIQADRQNLLLPNTLARFDNFTVTDTGVGLTDENYESFQTVDSTYKASKGGKGLGRFTWLKAFRKVKIKSCYRNGKSFLRRSFTFECKDSPTDQTIETSSQRKTGTTVSLIGFKSPYADQAPKKLREIAECIIMHFLPLFLNPHAPPITVSTGTENINLQKMFRDDFKSQANSYSFSIKEHAFAMTGFRLYGQAPQRHELQYLAHYRQVTSETLSKHLPNLRNKLSNPPNGDFYYLATIESSYLDEMVNSERTRFVIPTESLGPQLEIDQGTPSSLESNELFQSEITMTEIRNAAVQEISSDLRNILTKIDETKETALVDYVQNEAPQYRFLLRNKNEFIDQIPPRATKTDLEMFLHRLLYERQRTLKRQTRHFLDEAAATKSPETYIDNFRNLIKQVNEVGNNTLAQYVIHRRAILELLGNALSYDAESGKYPLEETVHQLIFPLRKSSDDIPAEQQNLWVIDERLTYHLFLTSDRPLKSIDQIKSTSGERPDIMLFNRRLVFSDGSSPVTSIVVIEFKQPSRRNYSKETPITQVYRIVRSIRKGHYVDKDGTQIRPLNATIPAYCYIICDLTSSLEDKLIDMSAFKTPDNLGYYGFNQSLNAYYEVISYRKLLDDAKKRNRVLFEKLGLPSDNRY